MALTFDSTVKELLNSPEAVEICKSRVFVDFAAKCRYTEIAKADQQATAGT